MRRIAQMEEGASRHFSFSISVLRAISFAGPATEPFHFIGAACQKVPFGESKTAMLPKEESNHSRKKSNRSRAERAILFYLS
jgi:hypothetical protein